MEYRVYCSWSNGVSIDTSNKNFQAELNDLIHQHGKPNKVEVGKKKIIRQTSATTGYDLKESIFTGNSVVRKFVKHFDNLTDLYAWKSKCKPTMDWEFEIWDCVTDKIYTENVLI